MINRETNRLLLRQLNENDMHDIFAYSHLKDVVSMVGMKLHTSLDMTKRYILHEQKKNETYGLILKNEDRLIGTVSLRHTDKDASINARLISIIIHPNYWGKGYGSEAIKEVLKVAFEEYKVDKVFGGCFSFNARSKSIQEKLGFLYENTDEESYEYNGKRLDVLNYSMSSARYQIEVKKW